MEPSHGCLEPESEKEVKLIFKADLESSYNVVLSINIPGVGKSILQAKSLENVMVHADNHHNPNQSNVNHKVDDGANQRPRFKTARGHHPYHFA